MDITEHTYPAPHGLWSATQCAAYLGEPIVDIDRLVRSEGLPHIRVQEDLLFVPDTIRAWGLIRQLECPSDFVDAQSESPETPPLSHTEVLERLDRSQRRLVETLNRLRRRRAD